jgi:GNAT superfamily N-acetyltransferase
VNLPAGLTSRPLTMDDATAVAQLVAAEEMHDVGEADTTVEDVVSEWRRPSYDVENSTLGVFDGDRLVAYADLVRPEFGYTGVRPSERGRGIDAALLDWLEDQARRRGADVLSSQVAAGSEADLLLEARGYRVRWTAWDLELPEGADIAAQPLADGYVLRDAAPGEHELVWALVEDAFVEFADRDDRTPIDDFAALVWERPGHQPWNLRLAVGADGIPVGATHVHLAGAGDERAGYVARIAVRKDRRGLGLGGAMLADAFALARQHGAVRCYLSTDTRTGALGLYERVGMRVTSTWVNRSRDL